MNKTIKKLERYLKKSLIKYSLSENVLTVDEKKYLIIDEDELLFDEEFNFLPKVEGGIENVIFIFGGRYYSHKIGEEIELKEFKYIGESNQKLPTKSFLGIHSGFELMNGIGLYKDWIKKAKFLGIKTLGICEYKTLRGALIFQNECKKNDIKPIFGMSIPVKGIEEFTIKLYVQNFQGWLNLLKFNSILNVDGKSFIALNELKMNSEGLFIIADPKTTPFEEINCAINDGLVVEYYQLDPVEFTVPNEDKNFLSNFEKYLRSDMEPISISDAYYLEKEDSQIREALWAINKSFDTKTKNQYFKNRDQYATELIEMYEPENKHWIKLVNKAFENEEDLIEECNFTYDTDTRHLPRYIMTKEESEEYETNEDLFIGLIKKGFAKKDIKDPQKYIERLKTEIDVLKAGDVLDYFLGLYDIVRYSKTQDMITGIGRGSAGGSLVAYLLGIIQVDPLKFDLLFERFLNSGRMGSIEECAAFEIETEDGKIVINEGTIIKISRKGFEKIVFIEDLEEGDIIIEY